MNRIKRSALFILCSLLFCNFLLAQASPVYAVIFTHIEDNTPAGTLGSIQSKQNYLVVRARLIEMGQLMKSYDIKWSLEPDWKILLAALLYEDAAVMQSTGGKNFLKYLKEDLNVAIDPHSHENGGYNYTDVAHLLDSLGVGGSRVIGGHIWDPSLPQFAEWDRFRNPVYGMKYPWAVWQGNILMGSGTPNHVNDPLVSGVWRPKDRDHYFTDDPNGTIYCVGKYKEDLSSIYELINLYKDNRVDKTCMLTTSYHVNLASITAQNGLSSIENSLLKPLDSLRTIGDVVLTDFSSLIEEWKTIYHENACIYDPANPTSTKNEFPLNNYQVYPNPFAGNIQIQNVTGSEYYELYNASSRRIWTGLDIGQQEFSVLNPGIYFLKIRNGESIATIKLVKI
jgi:hypothetical protein